MLVNTRCIKNEPYTHIEVSGGIERDGQKTNSSTKKKTETPANKRTEEMWMTYSLFLLLLLLQMMMMMVVVITQTTKELYENTPNNVFEDFLIKFTHSAYDRTRCCGQGTPAVCRLQCLRKFHITGCSQTHIHVDLFQ
jgi:hypothetical protein